MPEVLFELAKHSVTAIVPEMVVVNENETKKDVCIIVEDGIITKLDTASRYKEYGPERVVNERHIAASPSLVNAHTHSSERLLSGCGDGLGLRDWLEKVVWPNCSKLTPDDAYLIAKLFAMECIASGVGLFNDMFVTNSSNLFLNSIAKGIDESGIRGLLGRGINESHGDAEAAIKDTLEAAEKWQAHEGRIYITVAPALIHANSEGMLHRLRELAYKRGLRIHIHVAETSDEYRQMKKTHGMASVRYLDKIGFLDSDVMAAHLVWLGDGDIATLKARGVSGLYNPLSNGRLGDGIPPACAMLDAGVNLGIGTDGSASSDNQDVFAAMRFASFLPRAFHADGSLMGAKQVFAMATRFGYAALGLRGGELREGFPADIVLIDMHHPSLYPVNNIVSQLVMSAHPGVVYGTMVDGKMLYCDGKFESMDRHDLVSQVDRIVERLGGPN